MRTLLSTSLALVAACAADSTDMQPASSTSTAFELHTDVETARVIRNATVQLAVEVLGNDTDEVVVTVEGLPPGVTAEPLTIPAGETSGMLSLSASDGIALATSSAIVLHATAGDRTTSAKLMVRLTDKPGALDSTFSDDGKLATWYTPGATEVPAGTAMTPDGKILTVAMEGNYPIALITRIGADGIEDGSFADSGVLPVVLEAGSQLVGVAVRPDGVILLVSTVFDTTTITAFTADGIAYSEYGTSGKLALGPATTGAELRGNTLRAHPDGTLVIAGRSNGDAAIARVTPGGALDKTFSADGVVTFDWGGGDFIHRIALRGDGAVVLAGDVTGVKHSRALARLTAGGELDASFAGTGKLVLDNTTDGELHAVATFDDGRIVAFGARKDGKMSMLALDAAGSLASMQETVVPFNALDALCLGDSIVAAGIGQTFNTASFARVTSSGLLDTSFGTNGIATDVDANTGHFVGSLAVDADGRIIGAGPIQDGGTVVQSVMRVWL